MITVWDDRKVNLVIDQEGNCGKSILCGYLEVHRLGKVIENMATSKDIMRQAMCLGKSKVYFIDLPRALKKEKMNEFWSAIETLKNGVMYDDRYSFKKIRIDAPVIWVFTNKEPEYGMLTKDRWNLWKIYNERLVDFHFKEDHLTNIINMINMRVPTGRMEDDED